MSTEPILSSPPAFVLLGVIVGLAAYLRQISEARDKLIDEIEGGKVWNFPVGELHTAEKLKHLANSRDRLNRVAPRVIWLTILIAFRLTLLGYARFQYPEDTAKFDFAFRLLDLGILGGLLILLVGLWYMHKKSSEHNERIRAMARAVMASCGRRKLRSGEVYLL